MIYVTNRYALEGVNTFIVQYAFQGSLRLDLSPHEGFNKTFLRP